MASTMRTPRQRSDERTANPPAGPRPAKSVGVKEYSFSLGTLLIAWSLVLGVMAAVFFVGVIAGREQARKIMLEESARRMARLPALRPTPGESGSSLMAKLDTEGMRTKAGGSEKPAASAAPEPEIDLRDAGASAIVTADRLADRAKLEAQANAVAKEAERLEQTLADTAAKQLQEKEKKAAAELSSRQAKGRENIGAAKTILDSVPDDAKPVEVNVSSSSSKYSKLADGRETFSSASAKAKFAERLENEEDELEAVIEKATAPKEQPKEIAKVKEAPSAKIGAGWYIQVAAAVSAEEAGKYTAKLKKMGFSSSIERATVQNITYYRVLTGPFDSRQSAGTQKSKIAAAKVSTEPPFLKQVK